MEFYLSYCKSRRWWCLSAALMSANLENSAVATGLEMVSFHSNPKKAMSKNAQTTPQFPHFTHASKVMLKILQARLQQ